MIEIGNVEKLTILAAKIKPEPGHRPLLEEFRRHHPTWEFTLVGMCSFDREIGALIGRRGETVAEDYKVWVTGEYRSAGGDARAVYRKYKEAGMTISEEQGERVVITIPYGEGPDAFLQLEIDARRRVAQRLLLDWDPEELDDLLYSGVYRESPHVLSPWRYSVKRLTNIRSYMCDLTHLERTTRSKFREREQGAVRLPIAKEWKFSDIWANPFPDAYSGVIDEVPKEARLLQDWQESSAGLSGERLCSHWWLDLIDTRPYHGKLSYVPRWADSDCSFPHVSLGSRWSCPSPGSITSPLVCSLPHVEASAYRSIYALMAALEDFDYDAGYPMAWYFYMLHGNRVAQSVGNAVAKAVREGRIRLSDQDDRVLARWRAKSYGF